MNPSIIFCSRAQHLSTSLAFSLGASIISTTLHRFTGGELLVSLAGVCSSDVYIVQSFGCLNTNDAVIELLLTIDASRNAGAKKINVIIPYMAYGRQDRMLKEYSSVGMHMIANLLNHSDINSLLTLDLHAPSSIDLLTVPVINILGTELVKAHLLERDKLIVLPDHGSLRRVYNIDADIIYFTKTRSGNEIFLVLHGDVVGRDCLIMDDIIDSGHTICTAARMLIQNGAKSVEGFATHALFSSATCELINASPFSRITVSNSIANERIPKLAQIVDISTVVLPYN